MTRFEDVKIGEMFIYSSSSGGTISYCIKSEYNSGTILASNRQMSSLNMYFSPSYIVTLVDYVLSIKLDNWKHFSLLKEIDNEI